MTARVIIFPRSFELITEALRRFNALGYVFSNTRSGRIEAHKLILTRGNRP